MKISIVAEEAPEERHGTSQSYSTGRDGKAYTQKKPSLKLPLAKHKKHYKLTVYCSVTQSCPTLCDPRDCSMPGFPVLHYLPEFTQTHVHWINDAIQPSSSVTLFSCPQSVPTSGSFPMSWLFASDGQSISPWMFFQNKIYLWIKLKCT